MTSSALLILTLALQPAAHDAADRVVLAAAPRCEVAMGPVEADTLYFPPIEWNDGMPMMNWLSTGEQVTWILRDRATGAENEAIDWRFQLGDVVKIHIFDSPESFHPMNHPIHIHGQRFLVLAMDGAETGTLVWKDTAIIPVGSTMDLLVEMSNPGEYLHAGMMFGFTVEP